MSTNENTPLPDDAPGTPPVPVRRSALLGLQEAGWASVSELDALPEPRTPRISASVYLHGLRRHWVLATSLGLLCGILAAVATYFGYGARYNASAYFEIAQRQPKRVFDTADTGGERFIQSAFDIYKDTQAQLVKSNRVLTRALDSDVKKLTIVKREEGHQIKWLQDELRVDFPGDAMLMSVSLTARDHTEGKEVAKLVNAVARAYKVGILDEKELARRRRLGELDDLYDKQSQERQNKMGELRSLAEVEGPSDLEALRLKQQIAVRTFGNILGERSQVRVLLERARGELKAQEKAQVDADTTPIPELDVEEYVNTNPLIRQLSADLAAQMMAQNQTQSFVNPGSSSRYVQRHGEEVKMIQAQIDSLREGVEGKIRQKKLSTIGEDISQLTVKVQVLEAQDKQLTADLGKQDKEIARVSTTTIKAETTRGEIDRLNLVLANVFDERQKMEVELGSQPRIRKVQDAAAPETEARRGIRIALTVLAAIAGLCVPIGCVTWWDTRAERVNSSTDVSKGLGLTVLGSIPTIPARAIRQLGSPSKRHQTWHLRLTESIDGIAARLLRQAEVEQTRVILISSAASGEGKTTLATQLAMSLARNGRRTALVDFDLRRPAFHRVLRLPLEPGVSEVLRGQSAASEVVHETATDNLSVVTAGRWDRHALTALANGAAGSLFDLLRADYEFVVVDAAPILPVADTRFVSQHVDAVILSVFRDISRAPKITAACEILEAFGARCVEAVVTGPTENLPDRDLRYEASLTA